MSDSGIGEDNIYKSNRKKPVLASLLDSYSELKTISVSANKSSSCSTSHYLLTTLSY